jgi:CRP-like cAMP-binding protein
VLIGLIIPEVIHRPRSIRVICGAIFNRLSLLRPQMLIQVTPMTISAGTNSQPRIDLATQGGLRGMKVPARVFPSGTEIFIPDQRTTALYQVTSGWGFCANAFADGRRQILNFLLPGDLMPLECLFNNLVRQNYHALTPVIAVGIPLNALHELIEDDGAFAAAILRRQSLHTATLREHLAAVGRRNAYERVTHLLLELWYRASGGLPETDSFDFPVTQEVMADALGLSVIHVNRTLQRVRADRLFDIRAGAPMHIRVIDPKAAARIAGFDPYYLRAT